MLKLKVQYYRVSMSFLAKPHYFLFSYFTYDLAYAQARTEV